MENIDWFDDSYDLFQEKINEQTNEKQLNLNLDDDIIKVYVRLENRIDLYESSGYTLPTMLSEIGGLASLLFYFSKYSSRFLSRDKLFGALIEALYRIKTKNE